MKKITVSVAEDIKRKFIRTGSLCILAGCIGIVTGLIQAEGTLGLAISVAEMIAVSGILFYCVSNYRIQSDCYDEMAKQHMCEAKAYATDCGLSILFIMGVIILGITHVANILGFAPVDGRKLIVILGLNLYMIYFGIIIYIIGTRFAALEAE